MKKYMLMIVVLMILPGCAGEAVSDMQLHEMAERIIESQQELPELQRVAFGDKEFTLWLSDYYCIPEDLITDGVICFAEGVEASEIAILQLTDKTAGREIEDAWQSYIQYRTGSFEGYAPKQASLARNGLAVLNDKYAALLICGDTAAAKKAFLECFGKVSEEPEESLESQPPAVSGEESLPEREESIQIKDAYDDEVILLAWKTGDESALSNTNRQILHAAQEVIEQEITETMSDYEKELRIHDWITNRCEFDYSVFNRSAAEGLEGGIDTPYGVLIRGSAMCHGYSSTFQLFMDMLDIECITVYGIPGANGMEHSWNMVKLDGDWYCVDTAWDDPIGGSPGHTYFNVTSEYLRRGSIHRWDDTSVPEAAGTKYAYEPA